MAQIQTDGKSAPASSGAAWFSGLATAVALVVLAIALVAGNIAVYAASVVIVLLGWIGFPALRRTPAAEIPLLALQMGTAAVALGAIPALILR